MKCSEGSLRGFSALFSFWELLLQVSTYFWSLRILETLPSAATCNDAFVPSCVLFALPPTWGALGNLLGFAASVQTGSSPK